MLVPTLLLVEGEDRTGFGAQGRFSGGDKLAAGVPNPRPQVFRGLPTSVPSQIPFR